VARPGSREQVVFALGSHARIDGRTVLLVKEFLTLPDEAFVDTRAHGARWRGGAMRPILNAALSQRRGIVLFHTHPHAGPVSLSADDRRSARELLPTFQNLVPDLPHALVVLGRDQAAGLMLLANDQVYEGPFGIRWLGRALGRFPMPSLSVACTDETDVFHRQILLIGESGQHLLRSARIVVVGLGGGGSAVIQQLAHMGVGEIIGIDADCAERSNRGRLIGMTWWDTLLWRRRKTAIMARMVWRINPSVRFTSVPKALPAPEAVDAVKRGDIVVGCLDTLHARADLQELAWRFLVPYIDIGLLIQPQSQGHPFTIGGHIATLVPGEFCQWCIGMLSDEKLEKESGGRPRSYLQGSSAQAQVASMNGTLASQAVTEVLQMLTHYAPIDPQQTIKKYDGLEGTVQKWAVKQRPSCPLCSSTLAAGDAIWRPA
jgi:molybdopterin/thiamine biosynthesis adenylyltransferase